MTKDLVIIVTKRIFKLRTKNQIVNYLIKNEGFTQEQAFKLVTWGRKINATKNQS